jgi:hypothetical protein
MRFKRFPRVVAFLMIAAMAINGAVLCRSAEPDQRTENGSDKNTADHARQAGEEKIHAELNNKTDLKFAGVTLADAIKTIADRHHLEIQFDEPALKDASIDPQTALVTAEMRGVSLRAALDAILSQHNLTCRIANEVLEITTVDEANSRMIVKVYDIRDLLARGPLQTDYDGLAILIVSTISSPSWDLVGGQGAAQPGPSDTLLVSQTEKMQDQIAELLAAVRKLKEQVKTGKFDVSIGVDDSSALKTFEQALTKKVDLDFRGTSIAGVVERLSADTGLNVQLDVYALKDAGIDPKTLAITGSAKGITLQSALRLLLRPYHLAFAYQHEMLLITTSDKADTVLFTRLYPIGDLVHAAGGATGNVVGPDAADESELLASNIKATIAPPTWGDVGGMGTLQVFGQDHAALAISQTLEVHEEIADFLAQLREVIRKQPAKSNEPPQPVLKVYELRASAPGAPAMTPEEVAEVVKSLVPTKNWNQPEVYIRGVAGQLIVRQTPGVQGKIEKLLHDLDAGQIKSRMPNAFGGSANDTFGLKNPQNPPN